MGGAEITKEKLKKILASDRRLYYSTKHLNDKLYLHFGGYQKIQNLEEFTGLRSLWLESNAIDTIEGLENQKDMRSLFLQENCIKKIECVEHMTKLFTLNLSNNFIRKVENIPKDLNTLQVANNHIGFGEGVSDVIVLRDTNVNCLDIQGNKLEDPAIVDEVLAKMPELKVLYLKGNPVVKKIPHYRKTVIAKIPTLSYLDDRPVFRDDRRYAEAFVKAGNSIEAERNKTCIFDLTSNLPTTQVWTV